MSSTSSKKKTTERTPIPGSLEWQGEPVVVIAQLVGLHGVRGEIRVRLFNPRSTVLADVDEVILVGPLQPAVVRHARPHGRVWLLQLDGIDSPEAARPLMGRLVGVRERDLEPLGDSEYYEYQLTGLTVVDSRGVTVGSVRGVIATGGTDVLAIDTEAGERLVPLLEAVVESIDLRAGRIVIRPMEEPLE